MKAVDISRSAYSGYFTGTSIFSLSLLGFLGAYSLSRNTICCAALSVTMVEMTQVKSIISTTPLSSVSSIIDTPPGEASFMPVISMAMAPAACAEVRPNIMLPDVHGSRSATDEM